MFAAIAPGILAAAPRDFWIGVRGGPSIPQLSDGNNEVSRGYESRLAPNFGLVGEYFVTDHFSLVSEIDYSGQGGIRRGIQPITQSPEGMPPLLPGQYLYGDFKSESILDYLEVPVMAKYEWEVGSHWRYFAEAGPYIGFLLDAKQKTSGSSQIYVDQNKTPLSVEGQAMPPVSFDAETDVKGDLQKVNIGITAGMGLEYLINAFHEIFLDLRGEYGLTDVQKDTEANGKSHTGNAVFSLGYKFNFGG